MDETAYEKVLADRDAAYESLCLRCGQCCGAHSEDPCRQLEKMPDGRYGCKVYDRRHGLQETISGRSFMCVNIRNVITAGAEYYNCPYCRKT